MEHLRKFRGNGHLFRWREQFCLNGLRQCADFLAVQLNPLWLGLAYSPTDSAIWLDGQEIGAGGGVTIIPATNTWTNGFSVGSDLAGYEQLRSVFCRLETFGTNWLDFDDGYDFTNRWPVISNAYASWLGTGGSGADFAPGSPGSLLPLGGSGSDCTNGTAVYMTNVSYAYSVGPGQHVYVHH